MQAILRFAGSFSLPSLFWQVESLGFCHLPSKILKKKGLSVIHPDKLNQNKTISIIFIYMKLE